jgi:ABC-type nitrate/sulfonate/bicarbonate transport system ATPase subunit/ABC-type transporter Mla maintaining outer membrane lipid asymmetry permease subunit MlaE
MAPDVNDSLPRRGARRRDTGIGTGTPGTGTPGHDTDALVVEHLNITRPDGRPLLQDAALRVGPGELVLLVGPSGCGKSTLLLLLGGLLETEADHWDVTGRLACGDREIDLATGHGGVGGVVFQNYALFDELDARGNLRIALDHAPPGTAGLSEQLAAMLADIDPDQAVSACSGGQRQRLAIVRTVLSNQPVLLFDEPNSGLDIISSRRLVELIRDLCRTMGKPALIAVHHYEELLPLADHVLVMDPRAARLTALPPRAATVELALEEAAGLDAATADGAAAAVHPPARSWALEHAGRSRSAWFLRYVAEYLWLLCASPIMLLYIAAGAGITGFVTIWFGFNYYSYGGLLKSMLHDETVIGLGAVQCRVALPLICTLLFVARNSAVIAADVGNRVLTQQFRAMTNLQVPGRHYVFAAILSSVVIGSLALHALALLLGAWAAQETWHVVFPHQYRALFRTLYFHNVLTASGWPVFSMVWVFLKAALSALLAGIAAIMVALGPKPSSQAVNHSVANAIVIGVIIALLVHAGISVLTTI